MAKSNQHLSIVNLFEKFVNESRKGKRLQKNGTVIKPATLKHYKATLSNLKKFEIHSQKQWVFNSQYKHTKANFLKEKTYYKKFYDGFTSFFYNKGCVDNTVAVNIKNLRTCFGYLINSKGYEMGNFYKDFYARREEIPVIVLNQEQLKSMINNKEFENSLSPKDKIVKDIFVVGCSIGLRFSDLMSLRPLNLERTKDAVYIVTKSQKTNTYTRIKLPDYVIKILELYKGKQKTLLPELSLDNFNIHLKKLGELAGWTYEVGKIRSRRGVRKEQRNANGKLKRFCELLTSHVMRKTAITTMLILGMPEMPMNKSYHTSHTSKHGHSIWPITKKQKTTNETLVRMVSGHAPNSREFYKYVKYSDSFMDIETDKVFAKQAA